MEKNKVKFGLNKVHYAKILSFDDEGVPTFAEPVRIPGAVSLSIDAEGEASNFYADDGVYYVLNNNSGYTGDLEIALVPLDFATDILGEKLDKNGVLTENNTAEVSQFALLFEFSGDKNKIRHCLFCCSASRPATESSTIEDEKEVKTETLSLTATALNSGLVKCPFRNHRTSLSVVPVPNGQATGRGCTSRNPATDVPRWRMWRGRGRQSYAAALCTFERFPPPETFWFRGTGLHCWEWRWIDISCPVPVRRFCGGCRSRRLSARHPVLSPGL